MEHVGIDKTKAELVAGSDLICSIIKAVKSGPGLGLVVNVKAMVDSLVVIVTSAKGIGAELSDLDAQEKAELGDLSFDCMKKIFASVVK